MASKQSETEISKGIKEYLEALGYFVERNNAGKVQTKSGSWLYLHRKGFPDLMVLFPAGRVVFIEVKKPGEEPTDTQLEIHAILRELDFTVLVVWSVQEVVDWVEGAA